MENINKSFEELIAPTNFIKVFKDELSFVEWCELGTIEDLECVLSTFKEYDELYEHCAVIVKIIKNKTKWNLKHNTLQDLQ